MSNYSKPNFLIIGAAKSGTTSLARYLAQHPDIFIPETLKEPRYFVSDILKKINRFDPLRKSIINTSIFEKDQYYKIFQTNKKYKKYGESSIHYFNHPDQAIPKIKSELGDISIFIILRNPVDRMLSNWNIHKEFYNINECLELENFRINIGYNSFWFYKYQSMYYEKVKKYKDNFTSCKVIIFEKFILNTQQEINSCFNFLGVDPFKGINTKIIHNKSKNSEYIESKILNIIKYKPLLYSIFSELVSRKILFHNSKRKKIKYINSCRREEMLKQFADDINKIEALLNIDLSFWT